MAMPMLHGDQKLLFFRSSLLNMPSPLCELLVAPGRARRPAPPVRHWNERTPRFLTSPYTPGKPLPYRTLDRNSATRRGRCMTEGAVVPEFPAGTPPLLVQRPKLRGLPADVKHWCRVRRTPSPPHAHCTIRTPRRHEWRAAERMTSVGECI